MSSAVSEREEADEVCASCGRPGCDDINLRRCNSCKLAKYCGVACQKNDWQKHKHMCKQIREKRLFEQPGRCHRGGCPICLLPHSTDETKAILEVCCSTVICNGCSWANLLRERVEGLESKCPFCGHPALNAVENYKKTCAKIKAGDPAATRIMGTYLHAKGDYSGAFKNWQKSAELGDIDAHYKLSGLYFQGQGVEKNMKKYVHHLEEAAIGGHAIARHSLGRYEFEHDSFERAAKHWVIAAELGYTDSMNKLQEMFEAGLGLIDEADFETCLRAFQDAVDASKSPQREAGESMKAAEAKLIAAEAAMKEAMTSGLISPIREAAEAMRTAEAATEVAEAAMIAVMKEGS
jgi:hypothetical protein